MSQSTLFSPRRDWLWVALLTCVAFGLRVWQLDSVPPGLRVDELSNTFVVSQRVLDGNPAWFYPEASGHEGLWHALQAGFMALFGHTIFGIRGASAVLGTLTIPLTWLLTRQLFGRFPAYFAAATLTVSFWSLVYSRTAIRHVSTPVFMLLALLFFTRALNLTTVDDVRSSADSRRDFLLAGLFGGITLHTYFAAWVLPAALIGCIVLCAIFMRDVLKGHGRNISIMFGLIALIVLPVLNDIRNMPNVETEGRVNVVAAPIHAALAGDFSIIFEHVRITLGMYTHTGDSEWLYNIAGRSVLPLPVGLLFWAGVLIALYQLFRAHTNQARASYLLLLLVWLGGIGPAFISVPPASLGHSIAAQSASYMLLALPLAIAANRLKQPRQYGLLVALAVLLVVGLGRRDLTDYFVEWPSNGLVRFLYHNNMQLVGDYLATESNLRDFGIAGTLNERWEQVALNQFGPDDSAPRWYRQDRAVMLAINGAPATNFSDFPEGEIAFPDVYLPPEHSLGDYLLTTVSGPITVEHNIACWENGLCLVGAGISAPFYDVTFSAERALDLPANPLNSFPPVPGSYDGQRLSVFVQLLDENGDWMTGDDGLWVSAETLQSGDIFRQRHVLFPPEDGSATHLAIGLYDPLTGHRVRTLDNTDSFITPLP